MFEIKTHNGGWGVFTPEWRDGKLPAFGGRGVSIRSCILWGGGEPMSRIFDWEGVDHLKKIRDNVAVESQISDEELAAAIEGGQRIDPQMKNRFETFRRILPTMDESHPITIAYDQMQALPEFEMKGKELDAWLSEYRMPFDPLWVTLRADHVYREWISEAAAKEAPDGVSHAVPTSWLVGRGLLTAPADAMSIVPIFESSTVSPNYRHAKRFFWIEGIWWWQNGIAYRQIIPQWDNSKFHKDISAKQMEPFRFLYFLESDNIEIGEEPVSRQVRRQAERKDRPIAMTVIVKQKKRVPPSDPSGEHIEYSHRFEVRGHYKHYPAGTQMANAAVKPLVYVPDLGEWCRKIWCPTFVKGPADQPLIVKTRRLDPKES